VKIATVLVFFHRDCNVRVRNQADKMNVRGKNRIGQRMKGTLSGKPYLFLGDTTLRVLHEVTDSRHKCAGFLDLMAKDTHWVWGSIWRYSSVCTLTIPWLCGNFSIRWGISLMSVYRTKALEKKTSSPASEGILLAWTARHPVATAFTRSVLR